MPDTLLNDFLEKLSAALSAYSSAELGAAWVPGRTTRRTAIYRTILQSVAAAMRPRLALKEQHCLIDFVLAKTITDGIVPMIAIESENKVDGTTKEVDNLCAMAAPVKVLITCAIWSRAARTQADREKTLQRWRNIHAAHVEALPGRADDQFVVIIGERIGNELRFFKEVLSGEKSSGVVEFIPMKRLPNAAVLAAQGAIL